MSPFIYKHRVVTVQLCPSERHLSLKEIVKMLKNFLAVALYTLAIVVVANSTVLAQGVDRQKLVAYLEGKPNDRKSVALIANHLEMFGSTQPLDALVIWAQKGFPEFHNEYGHWNIDAGGFHANFTQSLYYFIEQYPDSERGDRYLRLIEELRVYGQFTYPLTQSAYKYLTREKLEAEFSRLVAAKDPEERSRGFVMGSTLADKSPEIAAVYLKAAKDEPILQPRYSAIVTIAMARGKYPREITLAGLDRLLNDPDRQVRDFGGVLVKQGADFLTIWSDKDIPLLLSEMLKSRDKETRRILAMTVARLTTDDKTLYVAEDKWKDHPQEKFIERVGTDHYTLEDDELLNAWKEWWTPIIAKYMIKRTAVVC